MRHEIMLEQIEDTLWYEGFFPGRIGIVLVNTGPGYKTYIGPVTGANEDYDKLRIANDGAEFVESRMLWPHRNWSADCPTSRPKA